VDLQQVDIVGAEAAQRVVDRLQNVLARQAPGIGVGAHRQPDLGGDHHLVAPGHGVEVAPDDLFGGAEGIEVGGVEEVDAGLQRPGDERLGVGLVEHPGAPFESLNADFPLLSDPDKTVAEAYGVLTPGGFAARHTFYIGKDGKILAIDRSVRPATSAEDMAARLGELGVARR
jgi:hypothetical protein